VANGGVISRAVGGVMAKLAGTSTFQRVGPKVAPAVDKVAFTITGGRWTVSDTVLPVVVLTATGAKSGAPRTVPLAALQYGEDFVVVGSNFGREHHPAWSANLLAHPDARLAFRGEEFPVHAELLDDAGKSEVWPLLVAQWPLFDQYAEQSGRDLRVFALRRRRRSVI
jgi:deazaflavin-dependent oxidoreductase (nitroreductase family)